MGKKLPMESTIDESMISGENLFLLIKKSDDQEEP
jgi:hypothetical protein